MENAEWHDTTPAMLRRAAINVGRSGEHVRELLARVAALRPENALVIGVVAASAEWLAQAGEHLRLAAWTLEEQARRQAIPKMMPEPERRPGEELTPAGPARVHAMPNGAVGGRSALVQRGDAAFGRTRGAGIGRTYTTKPGDTLEAIAAYFYGDPVRRQRIIDDNPMLAGIKPAAMIPAGWTLNVSDDPARGDTAMQS